MLLNTGHGKGKSSAAFGVMGRGWARGWRVGVVQFVKGGKWKTGERKLADHLGIEWHTLGDGFTWESTDLDETAAKGRHAWEVAAAKLASGDYDLLILDELTYAVSYGWVRVDDVVAGIRNRAPGDQRGHHRAQRRPRADRAGGHGDRDAQGQARLRPGRRRQEGHRILTQPTRERRRRSLRPADDDDGWDVIALIGACWSEYPGCVMDVHGECPDLLDPASAYRRLGGAFWVATDDCGTVIATVGLAAARRRRRSSSNGCTSTRAGGGRAWPPP